jgi:hypothetical protein
VKESLEVELRESLGALLGWMEIAAICPDTIGKYLVPDMDGADIKRAREALSRAYEEDAERLLAKV